MKLRIFSLILWLAAIVIYIGPPAPIKPMW